MLPAGTTAEPGAVKVAELLETGTVIPPDGAAADRVTVQVAEALLPRLAWSQEFFVTTVAVSEIDAVCELEL